MNVALLLAAAAAFAGGAAAETRPQLDLVSYQPAIVAGMGFVPNERVRVTITGPARAERIVRAGTRGRFRARFEISLRTCDSVRITARGARGSRTWLALDSVAGCPETE